MSRYDQAVDALYQAPLATFVAERKRLAGELKAAGDKAGAATFAKLARPAQSAWAVNQLWWSARAEFDALLATAAKLKKGDMAAGASHRAAIAALRVKAAAVLAEAGHGAPESTLRRITTTLAAIAAAGGFGDDRPGTLAEDRDPPGFEALGIVPNPSQGDFPDPKPAAKPPADADSGDELAARRRAAKAAAEAAAERERAEAAIERRKQEAARAKRAADRHRLETAIKQGRVDVERREKEVARLATALGDAETAAAAARSIVNDLESQLASLAETD